MKKLSLDELAIIAFDFDGVFTDNKVICDSEGVEYVICSRAGMAFHFSTMKY